MAPVQQEVPAPTLAQLNPGLLNKRQPKSADGLTVC